MLPQLGPRVTISANTSLRSSASTHSSARPSDASRSRRGRPPIAPGTCAATLAQPTRKSFEGIRKSIDTTTAAALLDDVQTLPVASSGSEVSSIPHSVSAASLAESDLALLLGTSEQTGSTPLVFGTFPPVSVAVPADGGEETAAVAHHADAALEDAPSSSSAAAAPTKLKADSHEFYPQAYLAAAAATALAARTISTVARSSSNTRPSSDSTVQPAQDSTPQQAAAAAVVAEVEQAAPSEATTAAATEPAAPEPTYMAAEQQADQQQQVWSIQQWQQQQPGANEHWQQQHWQHWQAQQQQAAMMGVPVLVPVFVQPYPYPHYMQQQPQVHYMMVPAAADPAAAASHQQAQHMQQVQSLPQQQHHMQVPPSPGSYSLPADTCSLMSAATPAATPTAWQQHSGPYSSSRRPSSSSGSVVSAYSSSTTRRHRQQYGDQAASRESGTVTVSAMSCVKDAAGALAKVVTRHGNAMLLSLVKPGDAVAQATHVAAKSLAVARFYVNAHMAAAGAAGIDAAAALTGMDSQGPAASSSAAAVAASTAADDEVVFMPYQRSSSSSSSSSSRAGVDGADVPLGFMVAKTSARDLPVLLPPPVGIPACMQDKAQQQQGTAAAGGSSSSSNAAGGSSSSSNATLLKAGANTDVNKLSNAVIHNILGSGHVAMQLAGAAACHVAMRSLIKARDRLLRKFNTDIVATASFANEDTSSSIGRSTVFLRLDVMRSNLLQQVAAAGSAAVQAMEGQVQQQPAFATA